MLLAEARRGARLALGAQDNEFTDSDIDRALLLCLNEMQRICKFSRAEVAVTLTAGNASFTIADTSFRAERFLNARIGYVDKGAWSSGVSYAVRDMVSYGGRLYRCLLAHTSSALNTPPSNDWSAISWNYGDQLVAIGHAFARDKLLNSSAQGLPSWIAWDMLGNGCIVPVPDMSYKLYVSYALPVESWAIGTRDAVTLAVPDEYIHPLLWFGVPAAISMSLSGERVAQAKWSMYLASLAGLASGGQYDLGAVQMNPSNY